MTEWFKYHSYQNVCDIEGVIYRGNDYGDFDSDESIIEVIDRNIENGVLIIRGRKIVHCGIINEDATIKEFLFSNFKITKD